MTSVHPCWVFYFQVYCPRCDTETYQGKNYSTLTHNGLPALPLPMGDQNTYDCPACGAVICVGALPMWTEDNDDE